MLRKPVVLITGAGGEIGHGLITRLAASGRQRIVTLDLTRLDSSIAPMVTREFTGSILDNALLERILSPDHAPRQRLLACEYVAGDTLAPAPTPAADPAA